MKPPVKSKKTEKELTEEFLRFLRPEFVKEKR